ncbi:hypothetical protein NDU88_005800 [Pleurodeles waltl]|uniref:Secreted protein n=1 Tax=Pleurodeles waltl TaxID=8319 RepID=A0AAV7TXL9_PLEWA|nr:hypothetical protein NDU88_005800 [Pleurodeles waltl]
MGGLGLPVCTCGAVHRAGLLTWCLLSRPPGHRDLSLGPGPGPPGTLSAPSVRRVRHRCSYRPRLSPAGRVVAAIFFSLPGIGRISARTWDAGSPFFCRARPPVGPRVTGVSETASFCSFGPR